MKSLDPGLSAGLVVLLPLIALIVGLLIGQGEATKARDHELRMEQEKVKIEAEKTNQENYKAMQRMG